MKATRKFRLQIVCLIAVAAFPAVIEFLGSALTPVRQPADQVQKVQEVHFRGQQRNTDKSQFAVGRSDQAADSI